MLKRVAKKSVDSVGKNPNPNLNQQLGEIAKKNVYLPKRHVEDKRIGDNVLKGLQKSAKKHVG